MRSFDLSIRFMGQQYREVPKQLYRRVDQSVWLCSFIITGHEIDLLNRYNMAVSLDIGRF